LQFEQCQKFSAEKGKRKERTAYTVKNDYVIADINGGAMYPSYWQQRIYAPFIESLVEKHSQVPALNAHELRHTYGTLLYKSGTDIYTIQKLMGHASIEITTRIYVHNDIDTIKKAMKQDW
jgi:integrase